MLAPLNLTITAFVPPPPFTKTLDDWTYLFMHLSLSCPTTPPCGQCRGICRNPPRGTGLVISTFRESVRMCTYHVITPDGRREYRYIMVQLQTLSGSQNKSVTFCGSTSCMTKTKFSDALFQNRKLHSLVSWGLFNLNPPSGWGFVKPEVQIPIHPPMYPARGVVGLDIDRCIIYAPGW